MRSALLVASFGLAASKTTWDQLQANPSYSYDDWRAEGFGKLHPGNRATFEANLAKIRAHNSDPSQTWKAGINEFTALSSDEMKTKVIGRGYNPRGPATLAASHAGAAADFSWHKPVSALPASLDWRTKGVVTPVKNQEQCGGCWSFSAAETMESFVAIATGKLMVFSEQELIDCTPNPNQCGGTGGCNGATQELAFGYVAGIPPAGSPGPGITLESDYPYTAQTGQCQPNKIKPVATFTNYTTLPFNNYSALMNAVVALGPIAISAAAEPWQIYESGVFSSNCGTDVDHAIQLVGYGNDAASGLDYWLVRNSWSAGWGEAGYIRIKRFGDGKEPCAQDPNPSDGDGCKNGPPSILVCGLCGILSDSSYPNGAKLV